VICSFYEYLSDLQIAGRQRGQLEGILVVPVRRGTLVVPAEAGWIVKRCTADLTSRSLRKGNRRGTLVVPDEAGCDGMAKTEIGVIPSDAYRAGNHTVISDRPRFPHAKYGISLTGNRFTAGAHRW